MTPCFTALSPESITRIDTKSVRNYNEGASEQYRLQEQLGPYAYEGDLENARVALLLSNPGYGDDSAADAHTFRRAGWPLAGHHPEAPEGTQRWHRRLLGQLVQLAGAERVARTVVKLELTPWASRGMDKNLRLPSRKLILDAASEMARRGVVLVVMRAEPLWLESPAVAASTQRFRVNNWRAASLSAGNLPLEGWRAVTQAVAH